MQMPKEEHPITPRVALEYLAVHQTGMASTISPAKLVLLGAHFATHGDVDSFASLATEHAAVFRQDLVLRILLTYLPETVKPQAYVSFLQGLATSSGQLSSVPTGQLDTSYVHDLSDTQALKKARRLRLLQLSVPDALFSEEAEPLGAFLLLRAYRMDEEAGMLAQLPDLLLPFVQDIPTIKTFLVSTVLPLIRRNHEYYPQQTAGYSLREFQNLPDRTAVAYLLSETSTRGNDLGLVGRDLRGLVGPWLHNDHRWRSNDEVDQSKNDSTAANSISCPGWEQFLVWLVIEASKSWEVALRLIEQWDGPEDIEVGLEISVWLREAQQQYLDQTYARAVLASVYSISDASTEALDGAYHICTKIKSLLDQDQGSSPSLESAALDLSAAPLNDSQARLGAKAASCMRNDLLDASNSLTAPKTTSIDLLMALVLSAFILTRAGVPCTVRRAGDLAFIQDLHEQKSELGRLIRAISSHAPINDDEYWRQRRREVLWLRSWGNSRARNSQGIFSAISAEHVETEILKALLSNARYELARSIYEESSSTPLSLVSVQTTVHNAALSAFDNASNPNRTRGGLKKCDDILHAFPNSMGKSLPDTKRIEALLRATHALSDYRLVLKQGEPFSPVVLRVHSDPISIIGKVLEQNPRSYTRLQEFLEMGTNMVRAGLMIRSEVEKRASDLTDQSHDISIAEKRIVALCIEAALREDDFETAYSYVVSRLGEPNGSDPSSSDKWSWRAALDAGKYIRTERSQKPTHLGTASGNPEIRHLEQRIECLATALRIAPPSQLQEVLKTFRRCEEQLDSAIQEEAAKEDAWGAAGDFPELPGAFESRDPGTAYPPRNITASGAAKQAEEAPMSLFDLSRATARVATRNFNALSSLQGTAQNIEDSQDSRASNLDNQRTRKRDQLRDAATGTLVSGVGWLIGAKVNRGEQDDQH